MVDDLLDQLGAKGDDWLKIGVRLRQRGFIAVAPARQRLRMFIIVPFPRNGNRRQALDSPLNRGRDRAGIEDVEALFAEIEDACRQMDVLWVGGHTEISPTVNSVLVAGQMIGEVAPEHLCRSSDAKSGDALVLVKAAAIEATAISATEKAEEVGAVHGTEMTKRSQEFLFAPGISVVREAKLARNFPVHAMHDPTEGGVATGIREMCMASNCGAVVEATAITVLPETEALCQQFGLNPLGAISSGSLLLTLPAEATSDLIQEYDKAGIPAKVIGEIVPLGVGLQLREAEGDARSLPEFVVDEITKLYE